MNKLTKTMVTGAIIITGALSGLTTTAKAEESKIDQKQLNEITLKVAYNHLADFTIRKGENDTPFRKLDNKIIGDSIGTLTKVYKIDTDTLLGLILRARKDSKLYGTKIG